jgi:hypothetical protein
MKAIMRSWIKPVLIVIGRGQPEEVLLVGCKLDASAAPPKGGPNAAGCKKGTGNAKCDKIHTS